MPYRKRYRGRGWTKRRFKKRSRTRSFGKYRVARGGIRL